MHHQTSPEQTSPEQTSPEPPRPRPRRRLVLVALVAALALALVGCAGGNDTGGSAASEEAGGQWPVTIEHKLGETVIEKQPERIVALGDADIDAVIALGFTPVGVAQTQTDSGFTPWAESILKDRNVTVLPVGDQGVNIEQVAALRPDVILAGMDYWIDKEYEQLSRIAPTTAYEVGPYKDPWQSVMRQVGRALGKAEEAERIIADVEARVAKAREDHPELAGKEFAITNTFQPGSIGVLRSAEDSGARMLIDFGMRLATSVSELKGEDYAVQLSLERLDVLDVDVWLAWYMSPEYKAAVEGNRLFNTLDVVKRGSYVAMSLDHFMALRTPTPLAIPYFIDNVVPLIAKAATAAEAN